MGQGQRLQSQWGPGISGNRGPTFKDAALPNSFECGETLPPWPSLYVGRPISLSSYSEGWKSYLDYVSKNNKHKGRVVKAGKMVCVFITEAEITEAINRSCDRKISTNRRKTGQLMRRYGDNINQAFGTTNREGVTSAAHQAELQEVLKRVSSAALYLRERGVSEDLMPDSSEGKITPQYEDTEDTFTIRRLDIIGGGFALDLMGNKTLIDQKHEAIACLRKEGLEVRHINRKQAPFIPILDPFGALGKMSLQALPEPDNIHLDPVQAIYNSGTGL